MSVRIYALAKQLQVESKILVDICKRLRPDDKVSPLASLTDEEVVLVKEELKKGTFAPKSARDYLEDVGSIPTPQPKPIVSLQTGKIPVLKPLRPAADSQKTVPPKPEKSAPSDQKTESAQADTPVSSKEVNAAPEIQTVPILEPEKKSEDTAEKQGEKPDILSSLPDLKSKVPVLPAKKAPVLSEKESSTPEKAEKSASEKISEVPESEAQEKSPESPASPKKGTAEKGIQEKAPEI
ncbi:MAG: hypothetical protein Q4G69_04350, partial [Planctomycetia bacterium]|nr:hypothetical protein [Planctomycetia bacterium]